MHAVRSIKTACFGERYRGYFNMRGGVVEGAPMVLIEIGVLLI